MGCRQGLSTAARGPLGERLFWAPEPSEGALWRVDRDWLVLGLGKRGGSWGAGLGEGVLRREGAPRPRRGSECRLGRDQHWFTDHKLLRGTMPSLTQAGALRPCLPGLPMPWPSFGIFQAFAQQ